MLGPRCPLARACFAPCSPDRSFLPRWRPLCDNQGMMLSWQALPAGCDRGNIGSLCGRTRNGEEMWSNAVGVRIQSARDNILEGTQLMVKPVLSDGCPGVTDEITDFTRILGTETRYQRICLQFVFDLIRI